MVLAIFACASDTELFHVNYDESRKSTISDPFVEFHRRQLVKNQDLYSDSESVVFEHGSLRYWHTGLSDQASGNFGKIRIVLVDDDSNQLPVAVMLHLLNQARLIAESFLECRDPAILTRLLHWKHDGSFIFDYPANFNMPPLQHQQPADISLKKLYSEATKLLENLSGTLSEAVSINKANVHVDLFERITVEMDKNSLISCMIDGSMVTRVSNLTHPVTLFMPLEIPNQESISFHFSDLVDQSLFKSRKLLAAVCEPGETTEHALFTYQKYYIKEQELPSWLPFWFQHELSGEGCEATLIVSMTAVFEQNLSAENVQVSWKLPESTLSASCMVRNGGADEQASMDHESFTATWIIPRFLGQRVHTLSIKMKLGLPVTDEMTVSALSPLICKFEMLPNHLPSGMDVNSFRAETDVDVEVKFWQRKVCWSRDLSYNFTE